MSDAVVGLELSVEATKLLHFADGITRNGSIERISVGPLASLFRSPTSSRRCWGSSRTACAARAGDVGAMGGASGGYRGAP